MSRIIGTTGNHELSDIVETKGGKLYVVDSLLTSDRGYETMVFKYNKGKRRITNWADLYCRRYTSEEDMLKTHQRICQNLEKLI